MLVLLFGILLTAAKGDTELFSQPVIRVNPNPVTEGDALSLTCDTQRGPNRENTQLEFVFNKGGNKVQRSLSSEYRLPSVRVYNSGEYRCAAATPDNTVFKWSSPINIQIPELFSQPVIRVNPNPVTEGDALSLTCDTQRGRYGENTQLEFVFYKGRNEVQRSLSSEYRVPSVQIKHSGEYSCAVVTPDNRVNKTSSSTTIWINELRPEIRANPNPVTEGDTLSLTCDTQRGRYGENTQLEFVFYKGKNEVQHSLSSEYRLPSVQMQHSGEYSCAAAVTPDTVYRLSSTITIQIQKLFSQPVIRVSANPITEGDTLSLTCDTQGGRYGVNTQLVFVFRKGRNEVQRSLSSEYRLPSVRVYDSGEYSCAAATSENRVHKESSTITIKITELFSPPVIRVNPNPITEGDTLSLTCDTQRGRYGVNTQLVFIFRKGRNEVQRSLSSEYRLPSVRVYDSGDYSCAAATPDNTVYKQSSTKTIKITEIFSKPELRVSSNPITEGSALTLTCGTTTSTVSPRELQFAFYWDGKNIQRFTSSNQYQAYSVQLEDSGNYTCDVQHPTKSINKTSDVSYIQVVGGAVRPVVSLSPNWANILTGDKVTLTCDVGSTAGTAPRYSWYKDNKKTRSYGQSVIINNAKKTDSGTYQCQTDTSERSEPVSLSVTDGPLILQAPPYVYEGDSLAMRCYSESGGDTVFYKDNNTIKPMNGDELHTEGVNMTVTGTYRCSKRNIYTYTLRSDKSYALQTVYISVRELFSRPEIKVSPSPLAEGSNMTITCDTALHPSRITTPLLFAFYINGNTVREFSLSKRYRICSVGPGDWGEYSCAVRTPTGTVLKLSNVTQIQIHAKSSLLLSVGLPLLVILIIIIAVGIYKLRHKIGQTKPPSDQSNTGIPLSKTPAVADDGERVYHQIHTGPPSAGQDVCYTYIDINHLQKTSPAPTLTPNNNEIIYSVVMPSK